MMKGDVLASMQLDIADVVHSLNQVSKMMNKTMAQVQRASAKSSKSMQRDSRNFMHVSRKHAKTFSLDWWKRFGEVAIGFSIAYRAMNLFEEGVRQVADVIRMAIMESSELAAVQGKLAFWFTMHAKDAISYAEAFDRARVNIKALGRASVESISTIEEISTGLDELAQSVGAIPAKMIPAMASMVDFTVMVAKTTGSSTRQVRQEFQALMEGRIRTTDVMARSLIKTGIMTRAELKQMRNMTNQAQILEKVLIAVHEKWSAARDRIREASIEIAKPYWEKAMRLSIRLSSDLAAELEGVGNIFAKVFVEHAEKILKDTEKGLYRNVLMMRALRDILDWALTMFEGAVSTISALVATFYKMSDAVFLSLKALIGLTIVGALSKILIFFGRTIKTLVIVPLIALRTAIMAVNASFLLIPAAIYGTVVAFQAFLMTMGESFNRIWEDLKDLVSEIPAFFRWLGKALWEFLPESVRKVWNSIVDVFDAAIAKIKNIAAKYGPDFVDFTDRFGKNMVKIVSGHLDALKKILAPVWALLTKESKETLKAWLADQDAFVEGLKWQFKEGREENEKEMKARLRRERQVLSLQKQMHKDILVYRLEKVKQSAEDELDLRLAKIEELSISEEEANKLRSAAFDAYMEKTRIIHGNFTQGLSRGIRSYVDNLKTDFEMGVFFAEEAARSMQSAFSELFFDIMMDEFKSWEDYVRSLLRGLSRMLSELLSQMLMMRAMSAMGISPTMSFGKMFAGAALGAALGGAGFGAMGAAGITGTARTGSYFSVDPTLAMHEGRIPLSALPEFHDGLFPNEILARVKRDESVLTPKQMTSLLSDKGDNYNIFINAVDAKSFMELTRRNPQAIIRPFVEAIANNDTSLKGALKLGVS